MKELYIVGSGGFGREVAWLVKRINQQDMKWNLKGFIDDNKKLIGSIVDDYPVLGGTDYFNNLQKESWIVCAVGTSSIRKEIINKLNRYTNVKFATLIDPSVILSSSVSIEEGCILCAGTIATVNIHIGKHVIVNLDCTIGHDAIINDFATLYPSVNISGNVMIGEESEVGTGTQIIQGKKIGKETIVGAGAIVVKDLPDKCTAVGSPAKPIKFKE